MVLSFSPYTLRSDVLRKIFQSVRIFFLGLTERILFLIVVALYFLSRAELQDRKKLSYYSLNKFAPGVQRPFFFHNFSQSALGFTRKVIGRFERRV